MPSTGSTASGAVYSSIRSVRGLRRYCRSCRRTASNPLGFQLIFDYLDESVEPPEAFDLGAPVELRRVERPAQHRDRFVVSLERHGERMSILAAERE